jgi:predicted enzyme related to lactoylglutathione lyase
MGRPVVHFEIEGLDAAKLRDFYSSLFDWQIQVDLSNPAEYGMIDASSSGLGGAVSRVPDEPSSTWEGKTRAEGHRGQVTIFVGVPDVGAALQQAEELGGTRMLGPDPLFPGVEMGRFADPEGHLIGLITSQESATTT